jgi:hypothetical protein
LSGFALSHGLPIGNRRYSKLGNLRYGLRRPEAKHRLTAGSKHEINQSRRGG